MSMARRWAKWSKACLRWAAQNRPPLHLAIASSTKRSMWESQIGQRLGISNGLACCGLRSKTTETTSGMTSPARRTTTVSPTRTSLRRTSSSLWSVALVTVTPPTSTGDSRATGVIAPVRPTWTSIPKTVVISSWAGYLWAIANRGARETNPKVFCWINEFTL